MYRLVLSLLLLLLLIVIKLYCSDLFVLILQHMWFEVFVGFGYVLGEVRTNAVM